MGRNAKRRREARDCERAAIAGKTQHRIVRRPAPKVAAGAKVSPAMVPALLAGMAAYGAVKR